MRQEALDHWVRKYKYSPEKTYMRRNELKKHLWDCKTNTLYTSLTEECNKK